jgi:hypothetical protein
MLLRSLEAIISGATPEIGEHWLSKLRAAENLKSFRALSDAELRSIHEEILRKLARWFEKEADKNEIGAFFVMVGKEYCALGIPVSELTMALTQDRKAVVEYLVSNEDLEGAHRIYALMDAADQVADFFMLGSYYLTKGYLEETFLRLRRGEKMSNEVLGKYFKDDFFFKDH